MLISCGVLALYIETEKGKFKALPDIGKYWITRIVLQEK